MTTLPMLNRAALALTLLGSAIFATSSGLTGRAQASSAVPLPASLARGEFHHPNIPYPRPFSGTVQAGWASSNWSGYALTGSTFTSITGHWTVPAVSATTGDSFSSSWIGIDGFTNSDLIQTGTESDYSGGAPKYDAWWEILPANETVIPSITVQPGDTMSASITKGSGTSWTITITDLSNKQSFSTVQTYTGPEASAEWIEEAPMVNGSEATLAHYGITTFDPGTVNGANPNLTASEGGVMFQNNQQVSTPSGPDMESDGFNVAYGSSAPSPPPGLLQVGVTPYPVPFGQPVSTEVLAQNSVTHTPVAGTVTITNYTAQGSAYTVQEPTNTPFTMTFYGHQVLVCIQGLKPYCHYITIRPQGTVSAPNYASAGFSF